ncbi:hypothetical protein L227DRAFT_221175 [Lentinus tigrinus ALCF2SS1-6]|uniref:Uncharacterized protein n=1 Tax=Lentinus tigrinus ALCF2SS1-6 TaxID=1328759 RepID=A0A5C2S2J4_9APHY|nr:hypothetical protein L227DRAFT_221175 [Lentinus tigrinus ALCF2SS1-6]
MSHCVRGQSSHSRGTASSCVLSGCWICGIELSPIAILFTGSSWSPCQYCS